MWSMILKNRNKPDELKMLDWLAPRMEFSEQEKQRHYSLRKGFEGEIKFDIWLESLEIEHLILNDLLLEVGGTTFQIDSLVIIQDAFLVFEVKYYAGDYYYEGERLKKINGSEIKDPLLQLKRCISLLRQLFESLGFRLVIESSVVFINPEFTLYQSPKDAPIIFPSQLNRYMKNLNKKHSKLTNLHRKIAEKLLQLHQTDSPYKRLPHYEYEQLKKGLMCEECHQLMDTIEKKEFVCSHCGTHEKIDTAVMRSIEEIRLLFPERKLTTALVYDWCNGVLSRKIIRHILKNNFNAVGTNRHQFFE
ncbi:nuclease-related domain-containing protein [Mesobacillus jeotgali]|uniref:nuclease-related domain-containing protein n=1 Tax=Mesobacillus jeotgali TaxID=129985 RepID=UPI000C83EF60|nr:nuclease-related domain-containing protein [Mesobacillus jeotgali]